jgi:hypothetical protein
VTRGNKEGRCVKQSPKEQGQGISSPSLLMELKFELNTHLTISCVVAVASNYGLASISTALNSVPLAFVHTVILVPILFFLFGWREFFDKFQKKLPQQNR